MTAMLKRTATMLLAIASSAVLSGPAFAQTTSDRVLQVTANVAVRRANIESEHRYLINREDCADLAADSGDTVQLTWTFDRTPPPDAQYAVKVIHRGSACAENSLIDEGAGTDDCDVILEEQDLNFDTLRVDLTWEQITEDTVSADCENRSDIHDVTLVFTRLTVDVDDSSNVTDFDQVRFEFRTTRPATPSNVTAEGGESTIQVDWNEVSDADSYDVFYSTTPLTVGERPENVSAPSTNSQSVGAEIDSNITVGVTYYVGVSAIDSEGNRSLVSDVVTVRTQPVTDFFELYRDSGGTETGCSAAGGASQGWPLALILLVAALRKRHRPGC